MFVGLVPFASKIRKELFAKILELDVYLECKIFIIIIFNYKCHWVFIYFCSILSPDVDPTILNVIFLNELFQERITHRLMHAI